MFKKYTSKIILVLGLFLTFFWYNNASAATIYFQDDFDSYNLGDGLSGKNGYYKGSYSDTYISDDVFVSSPYSLKMQHSNNRFYKDLTNDYTGLEEVYIEQDVYLSDEWSSLSIAINSEYDFSFLIGFNEYNGTFFYSPASPDTIIDDNTNCSSNAYCQSWFNLGLYFFLDKTTDTLSYSVYIDNVLIDTYNLEDYTSNLYTVIEYGSINSVPAYIDNFKISDTFETTPSPIDAVCGSDDGGTFSNTSEMTEACSVGSLIFPSFVETSSGWTWICAGINGGSQAYCSATLSTTTYPTLPTQEDCSSYTFPDKWICEIKNLLTSAFLPSESKLNELNIAINSFQGKAPFNYLSSAINKFNDLKNGISESDLNITLMSNTSEVNLNDLTGLYDVIKGFFTIMVVLAFIFWGVGYIKHFFK